MALPWSFAKFCGVALKSILPDKSKKQKKSRKETRILILWIQFKWQTAAATKIAWQWKNGIWHQIHQFNWTPLSIRWISSHFENRRRFINILVGKHRTKKTISKSYENYIKDTHKHQEQEGGRRRERARVAHRSTWNRIKSQIIRRRPYVVICLLFYFQLLFFIQFRAKKKNLVLGKEKKKKERQRIKCCRTEASQKSKVRADNQPDERTYTYLWSTSHFQPNEINIWNSYFCFLSPSLSICFAFILVSVSIWWFILTGLCIK